MANEKIIIDTRSKRKDGTYPLKLYIMHTRSINISIGMYATSETFENGKYTKKDPNFKIKNVALLSFINKAQTEMINLSATDKIKSMSASELKLHMEQVLFYKKKEKVKTFLDYFDDFVALKTNKGTITNYTSTRNKIVAFDEKCTFETIDKKWLTCFQNKMIEDGLKINSLSIHLRNIRAVFNYALDEEITTLYPFRKFKIKKEETRKRSLTLEQIKTLVSYECEEYQIKYRDIFMLIFYLIGINISDLLLATPDSIVNGRLEYHRNKTNKLYSIRIEPEAMRIIEKYRGKKYLLDVMDTYSDYRYFVKRMNTALQQIGEVERKGLGGKKHREPLFKGISSYWARHSWATFASELDIPIETISMALGHSVGKSVTNIYIKFNNKKIDEANRKVIDWAVYDKKPNDK